MMGADPFSYPVEVPGSQKAPVASRRWNLRSVPMALKRTRFYSARIQVRLVLVLPKWHSPFHPAPHPIQEPLLSLQSTLGRAGRSAAAPLP